MHSHGASRVLRPHAPHQASVLPGQTDLFTLRLPPTCTAICVRLRRKGGDPLLMVRCGDEPPRVPRRSKVVADAWDQEGFDGDAPEHLVSLTLPPAAGPGAPLPTVEAREAPRAPPPPLYDSPSPCTLPASARRRLQLHRAPPRGLLLHADR